MPRLSRLVALSHLSLALLGCAMNQGAGAHSRRDLNVITRSELEEHRFNTVFDVVAALRGGWLQPRGTDSFSSPSIVLVYVDNMRVGGVETLRALIPDIVTEIRHFDATEASARWGLGHGGGVISISTKPAEASREGKDNP